MYAGYRGKWSPIGGYNLISATVSGEDVFGEHSTAAAPAPLAASDVEVYPNPARGVVTVALPSGSWAAAEVVDVLGRHVAALDVNAGPLRWDASGRRPGLYVVRAWGPHGEVAVPVTVAR